VPYTGARPVAMGHNGKRDRCEKGRADTLICDARGRAVCFTSAEPTHLSKTMQPALRQLREIVPDGPVLLGFDRGGAYAEAFTACHNLGIDFLTYRRGKPAPATAIPVTHQVRRGRKTIHVTLADEEIVFSDDHTGPCRQLTLYERAPGCTCPQTAGQAGHCPHLTLILQVLTSDLTASAPDLLFALKGRWVIENAFKYLGFYGIDWLARAKLMALARDARERGWWTEYGDLNVNIQPFCGVAGRRSRGLRLTPRWRSADADHDYCVVHGDQGHPRDDWRAGGAGGAARVRRDRHCHVYGASAGRIRAPGVGNLVHHALWPEEEDIAAAGCDREGGGAAEAGRAAGSPRRRAAWIRKLACQRSGPGRGVGVTAGGPVFRRPGVGAVASRVRCDAVTNPVELGVSFPGW